MAMMDTDFRSALRTMISTANPDLDDDAVRARVNASVERCPQEAAAPRLRAWVEDEALADSRAMGDRLWILEDGTNPWFPETGPAHRRAATRGARPRSRERRGVAP